MPQNPSVYLHTTPPPLPHSKQLPPTLFFALLFILLIGIAIPLLLYLPQLSTRGQQTNSIQLEPLLANCAFFYQRCPTSSLGVATNRSVDELLRKQSSPLLNHSKLLYSRTDRPESTQLPPAQIVTLIASEYNLNPFLLLTLSELEYQTVTKALDVNRQIEQAGDQSAWFSIHLEQMAKELTLLAEDQKLAPNAEDDTTRIKTIKIGNTDQTIEGAPSIASAIVATYFAKHSTTQTQFEENMKKFPETYQQLFELNPITATLP